MSTFAENEDEVENLEEKFLSCALRKLLKTISITNIPTSENADWSFVLDILGNNNDEIKATKYQFCIENEGKKILKGKLWKNLIRMIELEINNEKLQVGYEQLQVGYEQLQLHNEQLQLDSLRKSMIDILSVKNNKTSLNELVQKLKMCKFDEINQIKINESNYFKNSRGKGSDAYCLADDKSNTTNTKESKKTIERYDMSKFDLRKGNFLTDNNIEMYSVEINHELEIKIVKSLFPDDRKYDEFMEEAVVVLELLRSLFIFVVNLTGDEDTPLPQKAAIDEIGQFQRFFQLFLDECIIAKVFPHMKAELCGSSILELMLIILNVDKTIIQIIVAGYSDINVFNDDSNSVHNLAVELKSPFNKSLFRSSSWACNNQTTLQSESNGREKDYLNDSYNNSVTKSVFTDSFIIAINFRISKEKDKSIHYITKRVFKPREYIIRLLLSLYDFETFESVEQIILSKKQIGLSASNSLKSNAKDDKALGDDNKENYNKPSDCTDHEFSNQSTLPNIERLNDDNNNNNNNINNNNVYKARIYSMSDFYEDENDIIDLEEKRRKNRIWDSERKESNLKSSVFRDHNSRSDDQIINNFFNF